MPAVLLDRTLHSTSTLIKGSFWSLLFLILVQQPLIAQQGELFINEIMASNGGSVLNENEEDPDWIELYNSSQDPIDLTGFQLSDDPADPAKHILIGAPGELTIPAQGHLLLWASGDTEQGATHLGFKISSSGEPVLLTSPTGSLIDISGVVDHYTNVSYGRSGDGGTTWIYFNDPTPASANAINGYQGRLSPPEFSIPAGFHSGSISVSITHPDPEATIYYSIDGSIPGPELIGGQEYEYKNTYPNPTVLTAGELFSDTMKAFVFSEPLTLDDPSPDPNWLSMRTTTAHPYNPTEYMPQQPIRKARVLRARAFREGYLPSEVANSTYFFTPDGASPYTLPVLSLTTEKENLFSHENGIYNAGEDYEAWRLSNPSTMMTGLTPANWTRNTEFPIGMEWFDEGAVQRTFHRNAGFRLHGSFSTTFRRKSLRLYFREEYGHDNLDHAIFPDQADVDYKRLVVHISGNDDGSTNMRDMTLQAVLKHMHFETQDARPAVVFLDGEFWGVHSMRERYDEKYFNRVLDIPEGEVDVVEINRHASIGDSIAWSALLDQVAAEDPMVPEVYDDLKTKVDMESHIDFHVAQVYVGNFDWPHNNWKAYRKRTNGLIENAPHGHDGRWRWLMFDLDWGFNLNGIHPPDSEILDWATTPLAGDNSLLFRRLLRNMEYKRAYINRAADMVNTAFRPEIVTGIIEQHRELLEHDMQEHVVRWPDFPWNIGHWNSLVDVMVDFGELRAGLFLDEMQDFFQLPAQHELQIDVSDVQAGWVKVNSIDLLPTTQGVDPVVYPWEGTYFQDVPVTLIARSNPGWAFSHWEGPFTGTDSILSIDLTAAAAITAVYEQVPYCAYEMVHHWHFNDLPAGVITEVAPDASANPGALIAYEGVGTSYMDATDENDGSTLNALDNIPPGKGLRVRNPSNGRFLLIEAPATGYRDVVLSFATHRTTLGADSQMVSYTIDPQRLEWHPISEAYAVPDQYTVKSFSLDGISSVYGNEHLAFKIEFLGSQAEGGSGNNRFDNILVHGRSMEVVEAVLCEGENTYVYDGISYQAGEHVHLHEQEMDCDHLVLVRVEEAALDTTVQLSGNTLSVATEGAEYQWLECADMVPISGATGQTFDPVNEGTYAVQVQKGDCIAVSECHYAPGELGTGIAVFPNPAFDRLTIGFSSMPFQAQYRMLDATGRLIQEGDLSAVRNVLDIGTLPAGTYVVHVSAYQAGLEQRWVKVVIK